MLLLGTLGAYAIVRARPGQKRLFFLSGVLFALAMLTKLFAAWPTAGGVLFLLWRVCRPASARHDSSRKSTIGDLAALIAGFFVIVGTVFVFFQANIPVFFQAVVKYHFNLETSLGPWQILIKGLEFFWSYIRGNPVFVLLALLGAAISVAGEDDIRAFYAWQIPSAAGFLVVSRSLQDRYLVYLVPALSVLAAVSLERLAHGGLWLSLGRPDYEQRKRNLARRLGLPLAVLAAVLSLGPSWRSDLAIARLEERETRQIARYIQAHTAPDDVILCDYPELNFHALRKSTYLGSSLSGGETLSGQMTGAGLIEGIEADSVQMVWINTHGGAHQLVNLRDYDAFYRYVQSHFKLVRLFQRAYQSFEVYHRRDLMPLRPDAKFGQRLVLTGAQLGSDSVRSGQPLSLALRWEAVEPVLHDYTVSLRLLDAAEHLFGQKDVLLQRVLTSGWQGTREQVEHVSTSQWPNGMQVMGGYVLPIAPATPPGRYRVGVLLYNLASGEVLPVRDALGQAIGLDCPLTTIEVSRPERAPAADELAIHQQVNQNIGADLRLLGRGPVRDTVLPGDPVRVALFWQALNAMEQDWQLVLRAQDSAGVCAAEGRFELANADYPTSRWTPGDVLLGQYDLALARDATAGVVQMTLNCVDAATGQFLLDRDYVLTTLRIAGQSRQFAVPETIQHRLDANLGDRVSLLGYDLAADTVRTGGSVCLTLFWQARTAIDTGYTVFTHLLGSDGQVRGQKDNVPLEGTYPTTAWLSGEVVVDSYVIEVPVGTPAGEYILEVGMYSATSGERLPVLGAGGERLGDRVLLPPVRVGD